jgi:hypothetical protein
MHFSLTVIGIEPGDTAGLSAALAPFDYAYQTPPRFRPADTNLLEMLNLTSGAGRAASIDDLEAALAAQHSDLTIVDGIIGTWTTANDNGRFDWYQVGGRYAGIYKLRPGATGELGELSWVWGDTRPEPATASWTYRGSIDTDTMMLDQISKIREQHSRQQSPTGQGGGIAPPQDADQAVTAYLESPERPWHTYALLDGVHWADNETISHWHENFAEIWIDLNPNTPLCVIDCHS